MPAAKSLVELGRFDWIPAATNDKDKWLVQQREVEQLNKMILDVKRKLNLVRVFTSASCSDFTSGSI
jgi:hypothetical protein